MAYDDKDLERLLGQGCLSGASYDRIEANVMRKVLPPARRSRSVWLWASLLPAAAALAGVALYLMTPAAELGDSAGFTAKGTRASGVGAVELACSAERPCRAGDTLLFVVDTGIAHGYLNASAQRIQPASPERIRFFPTEKGESPRVEAGNGTTVVSQGVRLGPSLGPGVYRVDIWFTDDAPSHDRSRGRLTSVELRVEE
jgi:hypothetical protein